jgi:NADH-quinone oxidoreductase subunit E/NADP-reducing hydrogenase subunit HndA
MRISELPKYDLKPEEMQKVSALLNANKGKKERLIPVLLDIQKEVGFLPVYVQRIVAEKLNVPEKDVYGVTTFYSYFSMIPKGKYNIRVCMGTACFVKGGKKIVEKIGKELNILPGQTSEDRKYSLQINRCVGACGIAPVIIINEKVYKTVEPEKVMDIVYNLD